MTMLTKIQRRVGVVPDGVWGPATARAILLELDALRPKHRLHDEAAFYAGVRKVTGGLDDVQVATIKAILATAAHWPASWLAYGMGTGWHEARLRPVEEIGKGRGRKYGVPGPHGGQIPYGRGLVQNTWPENYQRVDDELGLGGSLVANYALALRPDIAVAILVRGMEEAWFTGKGLSDYLPDDVASETQFIRARRIINGTDRAEMIAGYAGRFQDALAAGEWM